MLKLAALDADDLAIIAAHMQDATFRVGDIVYDKSVNHLVLEGNRFAWETAKGFFKKSYERHRTLLDFGRVLSVRSTGIDRAQQDEILVLLTIAFSETDSPAGIIELAFAGQATIHITVECIEGRMTDLGSAWKAGLRPVHT